MWEKLLFYERMWLDFLRQLISNDICTVIWTYVLDLKNIKVYVVEGNKYLI